MENTKQNSGSIRKVTPIFPLLAICMFSSGIASEEVTDTQTASLMNLQTIEKGGLIYACFN